MRGAVWLLLAALLTKAATGSGEKAHADLACFCRPMLPGGGLLVHGGRGDTAMAFPRSVRGGTAGLVGMAKGEKSKKQDIKHHVAQLPPGAARPSLVVFDLVRLRVTCRMAAAARPPPNPPSAPPHNNAPCSAPHGVQMRAMNSPADDMHRHGAAHGLSKARVLASQDNTLWTPELYQLRASPKADKDIWLFDAARAACRELSTEVCASPLPCSLESLPYCSTLAVLTSEHNLKCSRPGISGDVRHGLCTMCFHPC